MKEESTEIDDLEFVEIAEFKRSENRKEILRYQEQERRRRRNFYRMTAVFFIVFFAAVLSGVLAFRLSLLLVFAVLILESAIAVCLYHAPVWTHVLELMIGTATGIFFEMPIFMTVGALVYLTAILAWTGVENYIFWQ